MLVKLKLLWITSFDFMIVLDLKTSKDQRKLLQKTCTKLEFYMLYRAILVYQKMTEFLN
jgi:hypothetical protein